MVDLSRPTVEFPQPGRGRGARRATAAQPPAPSVLAAGFGRLGDGALRGATRAPARARTAEKGLLPPETGTSALERTRSKKIDEPSKIFLDGPLAPAYISGPLDGDAPSGVAIRRKPRATARSGPAPEAPRSLKTG
jgi:hypothetical protein